MTELTFEDLLPTTAELQPTHPTLGKLPVKLKLRSTLAPEFTLKQIENMHIWRRLDKAEKKDDFTSVAKDLEKQAIDTAAFAIIGWDNDKLMGSTYSPDAARKLMANPQFAWLRTEVNQFVNTDTNFFRQLEKPVEGEGPTGGKAEQPAG